MRRLIIYPDSFHGGMALVTNESLNLCLKNIIVGVINRADVLNYLIILGKLFILGSITSRCSGNEPTLIPEKTAGRV